MLSKTITTLLLLFTLNQLSAQFTIGVHGGVNASTIKTHGPVTAFYPEPEAQVHYFAGINTAYQLCNKWSAGLDVDYAVRGVGYEVTGDADANALSNSRRKNLDITPKVSYQLFKNLDLNFGVYCSFLQRHEVQIGDSDDWIEPFATYYSKTDVGLAPGLRYQIGRFSLLASGQLGLKKIAAISFTGENGEEIGGRHEKNRALQIGLGYRIFRNEE
jgi:hypothetical protein